VNVDYKAFGARVMIIRKTLGLSRQQMARHLDVSDRTICAWENGEYYPFYKAICDLHERYGMSLDWLITGRGEPGNLRRYVW
jgi:transcriptional regulator with XRE-family HTH domain